jgi:predicted RNA-binding protein associated with RNAse of E/G family
MNVHVILLMFVRFKALSEVPLDSLRARFSLIKYLNRLVTPLLYYIDISIYDNESASIEQRERVTADLVKVLGERYVTLGS